MDTSNYQGGTGGGESTMESVDWRTQMPAEMRQKIVIKIMDTCKKHHPSCALENPQEIKSFAQMLEERIYTNTKSQVDYMRKISMKLLTIESRSANLISNSAGSSVNPSDPGSHAMHQVNNHPQAGQQILSSQSIHNNIASSVVQVSAGVSSALPPGNGLSHSTISNISTQNPNLHNIQNMPQNFVNQRQMPARQQQQQQSQNSQQYLYRHPIHQIAKHNPQQNYSATSAQPHIQQQHQNLLQTTHFQPSSLSTVQQNQQPVIQHHQQSALRQQRQPPQASIVHQQPPPPQSNPMQRQQQQQQPRLLSQQNNLSNVQQPHQQSIGQHNNFPAMHQQHSMLNNQQSTQVMQSKVSIPQQNQSMQGQRSQPELQQQVMPQLQTQSGQLQQHQLNMNPHPNMSQRDMQQRLPTSGAFQQQNVIIDQQQKQLFQQQRPMPEASSTSSDSTAQTGNPINGDWQEEAYQKIKAMKDKYMPELNDWYPKLTRNLQQLDSLPQQPKKEQFENMKKLKHICESCLKFLQLTKTNIPPTYKEKLGLYEKQIISIITTYIRKPGPHLQQPLPTPHPHETHMNSPNSTMLQLKQLQHQRQMHQHFLQKQQLLQQQQQFNRQTKQQLQVTQLPQIGVKMESFTKPGPQTPSPNIDQQNLLTCVTKSATCTPLQSANSPFTMSSPSTPSTSHFPGDSEKVNSGVCVSSLSNATGNVGHQSNAAILPSPSQSLPFGISASPLLAEFTSPDENHLVVSGKSTTIQQPLDHLLKVVKSISAKSLSASVSDIGSVVSMIDSIAGSGAGNNNTSRAAIGEDLVATTKSRLQIQSTTSGKRKMKQQRLFTTANPLNLVSSANSVNHNSFNCLEASELESTATSSIKRPRIHKASNALLEEIRGINWGLIDTTVDISEEVGKGTVVKCSFGVVAPAPNIKSQYASSKVSPIQPLRLLVPANYPNCSPILLDKFPVESSKEEELEDLSMKAKWRFCSCLRRLSERMSLEEMARTWDSCARAVISEYAHKTSGGDGGTFTSKYGAWEDCLTFTASA